MPFIHRMQIKPEVRAVHETALKERLRQDLLSPALTNEQRCAIRKQLETIGKPKEYEKDSSPIPGAIAFD
jgi:hypothetical protein